MERQTAGFKKMDVGAGRMRQASRDLVKAYKTIKQMEKKGNSRAENLTAQCLIDFLKEHVKFKPLGNGFTVDTTTVCEND